MKNPEFQLDVILNLLSYGEITECTSTETGSNYTFYISLKDISGNQCQAIYKPRMGEIPLSDFEPETLYLREYASYLVSEELHWNLIPPTTIRIGPFGVGSVQYRINSITDENFFSLRDKYPNDMMKICVFDIITNNADRKGSHCIQDNNNKIWSIDHGICFNEEYKLRTVIWDYMLEAIPTEILNDLKELNHSFKVKNGLKRDLENYLSLNEVNAFDKRLKNIISEKAFIEPQDDKRPYPWPLL